MLIETFGFVGDADLPSYVRVELMVERGFLFRLSGVSTSSAREMKARIRSALFACGYRWPGKGVTVNISSADENRTSKKLYLPIAIAILASKGIIPKRAITQTAFSGKLSLDGKIRHPYDNQHSTGLHLSDLNSITHQIISQNGFDHLKQVIAEIKKPFKKNHISIQPIPTSSQKQTSQLSKLSLFSLIGEATAKRRALIAAADNHNIILGGPT